MRASQLIHVAILSISPSILSGQWTYSIALGTPGTVGRNYHILGGGFEASSSDTLVTSAARGRVYASLAASHAIPKSSLSARTEFTYQLGTSDPGTTFGFGWGGFTTGPAVRAGLREETIGLHQGLEWNAFPGKHGSPYLLTSVGAIGTRLKWNPDSTSAHPNRELRDVALAASIGFGIKARISKVDWFLECRRQAVGGSTLVTSSMPFMVGARFTP